MEGTLLEGAHYLLEEERYTLVLSSRDAREII